MFSVVEGDYFWQGIATLTMWFWKILLDEVDIQVLKETNASYWSPLLLCGSLSSSTQLELSELFE